MVKTDPRKKRIYKPLFEACPFCVKDKMPDYKDYQYLRSFLTDRARIYPASRSGVCSRHQRALTRAIKHARHLALLPFVEGV